MDVKIVFFDIGNTLIDSDRNWLPGVKELLAALKAASIRIGIISNTGDWGRDQLQEILPEDFDLEQFEQDVLLLSSEVGVAKPDLNIFLLAIQHAGVSPWQAMFVGESLGETIAAQSAGMRSARICKTPDDYVALLAAINDRH